MSSILRLPGAVSELLCWFPVHMPIELGPSLQDLLRSNVRGRIEVASIEHVCKVDIKK